MYIIDNTTVYTASSSGTLFALDATTGDEIWTFEAGDRLPPSPTIANGSLYVASYGSQVYAVKMESGEIAWRSDIKSGCFATPTGANGQLFTADMSGRVYGFDEDTEKTQWTVKLGDRIVSSPTVANGVLYVGCWDGNLYAIGTTAGETQWSFETGNTVYSSLTVVDGVVYIGSDSKSLYAVQTRDSATSSGSRADLQTLGYSDTADADTATPTETPKSTPTTVQTPQTTPSLRGRVGNAETIVPLPVGENQCFTVRGIPDEPPDRLAFVGADSTLLDPQETVDAAVAYTGRGYSIDSTDRLADAREAHSQFETAGAMARAANIAAELSGALALAKVDPTASASQRRSVEAHP